MRTLAIIVIVYIVLQWLRAHAASSAVTPSSTGSLPSSVAVPVAVPGYRNNVIDSSGAHFEGPLWFAKTPESASPLTNLDWALNGPFGGGGGAGASFRAGMDEM